MQKYIALKLLTVRSGRTPADCAVIVVDVAVADEEMDKLIEYGNNKEIRNIEYNMI